MKKYIILFLLWGVFGNAQYNLFARQNFAGKPKISWDGLLAYYKLDGNANDALGNYNGIPFSMVYGTGKIGQCGLFNLTNSIDGAPTLNNTSFTIIAWIKLSTTSESIIYSNRSSVDGNPIIQFYVISGKLTSRIRNNAGSIITFSTSASVNSDVWLQVAMVYDMSANKIYNYINGVESNSATYSGPVSGFTHGKIGADALTTGGFNGLIDAPCVFNRALTAAKILEIYNIQNAGSDIL